MLTFIIITALLFIGWKIFFPFIVGWFALRQDPVFTAESHLIRPIETLIVLENDPFYVTETKQREAEWFAALYAEYGFGRGSYLRRIHYQWASLATIVAYNGQVYENTDACWGDLQRASLYARYLGLIPSGDLDDHRSPDVTFYLAATPGKPRVWTSGAWLWRGVLGRHVAARTRRFARAASDRFWRLARSAGVLLAAGRFELPKLGEVENEDPVSPYHLEILCEKTACADVLDRMARRHSLNVIYGAGDMSETRCQELMRRIVANGGRKVRLLYISDHDPKGHGMPVGVARKLEFMIQRDGLNIDLQLRHIALTKEQCAEYDLPRIPIKATDRGRARFEAEFGEGRVELDALEALHPGALARIIEAEIAHYHIDDDELDERSQEIVVDTNAELEKATKDVHAEHASEIEPIVAELGALAETAQAFRDQAEAAIGPIAEEIAALAEVRATLKDRAVAALAPSSSCSRYRARQGASGTGSHSADRCPICRHVVAAGRALRERAQPVLDAIAEDLRDRRAAIVENLGAIDAAGDEDEDPLFDSARDYVEQIDRYKQHQAKPTGFKVPALKPYTCAYCAGSFTSVRPARWCSDRCPARNSGHAAGSRKERECWAHPEIVDWSLTPLCEGSLICSVLTNCAFAHAELNYGNICSK